MANNRLYIYDPENNEAFMLAKGWGVGWKLYPRHDLDDIMGRLEKWFEFRDFDASNTGLTSFKLCTDNDLPGDAVLNQ